MAIDGAAWVGFGGVVAGALMGYASSAVQESARRRHEERRARQLAEREDRIRFEDRRFNAYVAVVETANQVYTATKYPAVVRVEMDDGVVVARVSDLSAYLDQIHTAYAQFRTALSAAFLLTTSARTRQCLAALTGAVRDLVRGADEADGPGDGALQPLYHAHRRVLRAAERAMREELGIAVDAPGTSDASATAGGPAAEPAEA